MILISIAGKCAYVFLWILATAATTLAVAASVPSLAVLWLTLGYYNSSVDQYIVCIVDAYDSIVVGTLLSMAFCMVVDLFSCLFVKSGQTLVVHLCQSILSTLTNTRFAACEREHGLHRESHWPPNDDCKSSVTAPTQAQADDTCPPSLAIIEQGNMALSEMQADDPLENEFLDASENVRGLEIRRGETSPDAFSRSQTCAGALLNETDRADAEAEQAAIACQIHRLLQASIPDVDPYFATEERGEFERHVVDAEDVEVLGDMVTQWLRQREDLQREKDRLLLLFHMRGLDSTSRLYEQSDTEDSHTPRLVVGDEFKG